MAAKKKSSTTRAPHRTRSSAATTLPHSQAESSKRYALFDLDFTLLPYDTMLLFGNLVLRRQPWRIVPLLLLFLPVVPLALLRLVGSATLKRAYLTILVNMRRSDLEALATEFVSIVEPLLYPELRQAIATAHAQGETTILNTAAPDFYATALGHRLGFDHVCATRITLPHESEGRLPLLLRLPSGNNKGSRKLLTMASHLPTLTKREQLPGRAWSDSSADLPMLYLTEEATLVHPARRLRDEAKRRGWQIVTPAAPWRGATGRYLDAARQIFGLYRLPRSIVAALSLCLIALFGSGVGCTNFSAEKVNVNPPILLGIERVDGGHVLIMAAQNTEIGFSGYRLYNALTGEEARKADSLHGFDCEPLQDITNQAIEYRVEVIPSRTSPSEGHLCSVPLALTPGTWVTMRALIFQGIGQVDTSMSSNALPVP